MGKRGGPWFRSRERCGRRTTGPADAEGQGVVPMVWEPGIPGSRADWRIRALKSYS